MIELPERALSRHIAEVILWSNGVVMVFDHNGEPVPELQGTFHVVVERINALFDREAWLYADWRTGFNIPLNQIPCLHHR